MRTYDLSESSVIAHWMTHESGLIKTVIKGAREKKSPYNGRLELYSICDLEIAPSRSNSDLHALRRVETVTHRPKLRISYQRLLFASYCGSLVDYWLETEQSAPEIYELLIRALGYIDEKDLEWKAVTYFEQELSRLLGYSALGHEVRKIYQHAPKLTELRTKVEKSIKTSS